MQRNYPTPTASLQAVAGVWTSIAEGNSCIGAFLNCGELGVEAYDADDVLIGVCADEDAAVDVISNRWDAKVGNGGDPHVHPGHPPLGIASDPNDGLATPVEFLEKLRPGRPWMLIAIVPDGLPTAITARTADQVEAFVRKYNGKRNLYYSVNPTRTAMHKKTAKTDIVAIEYIPIDLDPADGEMPEAAKARYLNQLLDDSFEPKPTAMIDSGNGLNGLVRLFPRIELGEPIKNEKGELEFSPEDQKKIADVETRAATMMRRLGAKAGTQNIDRILRLPGTINLPNAKKRKDGRVACQSKLLWFNDVSYLLDAFPKEEPSRRVAGLKLPSLGEGIEEKPRDESGSGYGFRFMLDCHTQGMSYEEACEAILADNNEAGEWANRVDERQLQRAWERSKLSSLDLLHKPFLLDPADPLPSATTLVATAFTGQEGRTLHRHRETFWGYNGASYRLIPIETIDGTIWGFLDRAVRRTKKGRLDRFKPSRAKVADVRAALAATCLLDNFTEPPTWLARTGMPPAEEFFACGNGLLHVPTGTLYPSTPDYFGVVASNVYHDPSAPLPRLWLRFLEQVLDDDEAIMCLQDWMGYLLTPDTSQQKILFMEGPRRSGKGTWARITTALLGKQSVAGPTMSQLSEIFGLEPLITKSLALISDARIGARTDKSTIAERLLAISGEDTLTVNRKYIAAWTGKLPTRFAILTNELPAFGEGSGALVGRFNMLVFPHSFYGREDINLTRKLTTELPGILNWSMAGYRRLRERGHFIQPKNALKKLEQIEMLSAPIKAFIRDCCKVGPGLEVDSSHLFQEWRIWCDINGGQALSKEWFSRNLFMAVPGVTTKRTGHAGSGGTSYIGITLNSNYTVSSLARINP